MFNSSLLSITTRRCYRQFQNHLYKNFVADCFQITEDKRVFPFFVKAYFNDIFSNIMATNRYCVELSKRGTAGCKNCKQKIEKGLVRIGKIVPNPFTDSGGEMKQWFHIRCMFEKLSRARATTKKIDDTDDLEGWDDINQEAKNEVLKHMNEFSVSGKKTPAKKKPKRSASRSPNRSVKKSPQRRSPSPGKKSGKASPGPSGGRTSSEKDDLLREFRRLCALVAEESSYNNKTAIVSDFFDKGSDGKGFKGDLYLWIKMLLPGVNKRVYNLQSKQLIKLFSEIFDTCQDEMLEDLEQGDVAETIGVFFESSKQCQPKKRSTLTLQEVDDFLEELTKVTKEDDQTHILKNVAQRCTVNDLKMFVRLIKHDLRIGAGPKHILEALNPSAYQAFQASRNLKDVVKRTLKQKESGGGQKGLSIKSALMTPVLPMLAEACRTVDTAFKKCPNGLLVEIKYDGERVQVHKKGNEFSYFSRSLKPVMPYKVAHLKEYIPKAFPYGDDLILDSEILLVDNSGKPLPFGTLGVHKKNAFKDATVCLFVFDCLLFNDENLMNKPLVYRRRILQENMKQIKNHVMFSEMKPVEDPKELKKMIQSVIKQGLEGLIIKDKKSIYEPGKRHWLKVKKDYLEEGAMADSADLVVLGAYYGTGNKGGMKSIFLMGCLNERTGEWCTVTKVHTGHDDATLARLQRELDMVKISKDPAKVPSWLNVNKSLIPDFVARNPDESQVWEITGAEFSKAEAHTAAGISIRFPRVTRIRDDKYPEDATTLQQLQKLYKASKQTSDLVGLAGSPKHSKKRKKADESDEDDEDNSSDSSSGSSDDYYADTDVDSDSDDDKKKKSRRSGSRSPKSSKRKSKSKSKSSPAKKLKQEDQVPAETTDDSTFSTNADVESSETAPTVAPDTKHKDSLNTKKSNENFELPSVFTNVKLFLPSSIENFETLKRYFIAYDGILVKDYEKAEADYVVGTVDSLSQSGNPKSVKVITPDWLWDCIKLQKILPAVNYEI